MLIHPTIMARSAWLRKNLYSIEYPRAEDYELWCRVCRHARIANIDTPLLFYREGVPLNLRAYMLTCQSSRRIVRCYGPATIGSTATAALVFKSALKECVYRLARPRRIQFALLRRRSAPLTVDEQAVASRIIASIIATPVPGLLNAREEHRHRGSLCSD